MANRWIFGLVWVLFLGYAFLLAPPDQAGSFELIAQLSSGQWQGINPYVVSLFNLMGIWPILYTSLLLFDGREQTIRAWPFAIASFAVGAFALLPYLALRKPAPIFQGEKSKLLALFDSRWIGVAMLIATLVLFAYAIARGDWSDFVSQWQQSRFIHVMSLDFCMLSLLFPVLMKDDWLRRGMTMSWKYWLFSLVPMIGAALYVATRSPQRSDSEAVNSPQKAAGSA